MNNQYLVAKYIPDLDRMEPRNIGVVFWANGAVKTRFADPELVGLSVDDANYERWIEYWRRLAGQKSIQIENRRPASVKTSRFISEFQRAQRGNYMLETGGELVDDVKDLDEAADFLFSRLVSSAQPREARRADQLRIAADSVLSEIGLIGRKDFVQNYPVALPFGEVEKQLHFHYGLGDKGAQPKALLLRVNIGSETSVSSAMGKFGSVDRVKICPKDRCLALYEPAEDDENSGAYSVDFLNMWSVPVDVSAPDARQKIAHYLKVAG
jgi:hypothetical protein